MAIIHWIRTFFLLPRKTMPREIGPAYDLRNETVLTCKSKYEEVELKNQNSTDKEQGWKVSGQLKIIRHNWTRFCAFTLVL